MLKVKGENPLIEKILQLKGVPYCRGIGNGELETKEFILSDQTAIIHYLDERFPVPQLISGDIENKARIRELSSLLLKDTTFIDGLAENANPFVFGESITLVDLVVAEYTKHTAFKKFMEKLLSSIHSEEW